ncbi:class I SAM-dependent methyltransferase [soil metagenome]
MNQFGILEKPSPWIVRFAALLPAGEVLDLACGSGRHARFLATAGHSVLAVDRNAEALASARGDGVTVMQFDFERASHGSWTWPFERERFAAIVVTNYLHRPLFPFMLDSLAAGGVLLYETFAQGNERFGKPSNPDFLLTPGELLRLVLSATPPDFRVVAYEEGRVDSPRPAIIQRICAVKSGLDAPPSSLCTS